MDDGIKNAKKTPIGLCGIPQHIVQRGNNRQVCFASESDFVAYAHFLNESALRFDVDIHAWVFMTNHVHLLVTPQTKFGVSQMMQYLGGRYVPYYNYTYKRSGTLWEGRFKSCLVDSERYLLSCYRYIEMNPVRAGMVTDPADYKWSSYSVNALGKSSAMCKPHQLYLELGKTRDERRARYRALFENQLEDSMITDLRYATQKGLILGTDAFKHQVEELAGQKIGDGKPGRPKKVL